MTRPLLPNLSSYVLKLEEIWKSGWMTNGGKQNSDLVEVLRTRLRCANVATFNNGTTALLLALRALRLRGEVVTTPFTFPATTHAIDWAGLTPVFADIDARTGCLDPAAVEAAVTKDTSAILAVHVFGIPCDVEALGAIAKKHGLKLIYDAAHAFGVEVGGRAIGSYGDISMFSLHATKLFHTAEGGALTFRDASLAKDLHLLHNFGIADEDHVAMSGINGKMNELQAALGLCVMEVLDEEYAKRATVVKRYRDQLRNVPGVECMLPGPGVRPSMQYMPVRIGPESHSDRDAMFNGMRQQNIMSRRYFRPLCSSIEPYAHLPSAAPQGLPNAVGLEKEILCLPLHGGLKDEDVDRVCEVLVAGSAK
nr:DegT/DnrJ/EryC1/StrS family aminotransferase [Phragmitibacter flavus]